MNIGRLICLYAPKQSGKSTAADALVGYRQFAFADPVRDAVAGAYGLDRDEFRELSTNQATKEVPTPLLNGLTPREALVDIGMYYRENVDREHWAKVTCAKVQRYLDSDPEKRVVITDCRFENEARAIQDMGGLVVGIIRADTWKPYATDNPAENAVYDGFTNVVDCGVHNNTSLDSFVQNVRELAADAMAYGAIRKGSRVQPRADGDRLREGVVEQVHADGTFTVKRLHTVVGANPYYTIHRYDAVPLLR